ncbi:MAG: hypothetical protein ACXWFB_04445 [Nitrososphaeraceae archaeon]
MIIKRIILSRCNFSSVILKNFYKSLTYNISKLFENATTTTGQQNIVVVGGGGDLAGSTVIDIPGLQKITTELKLIGSGSIYNLEKVAIHLFPLTTP